MTHTSALLIHSMSGVVLNDMHEFCFTSALFEHHPFHPNQILRKRVQTTHHEPNTVDESQLSYDLLCLTRRCLVFIYGDSDTEFSLFSVMMPMGPELGIRTKNPRQKPPDINPRQKPPCQKPPRENL